MDKLQWFKFSHTDWMMGKIQRCPEVTQARFLRLICLYWNKECNLSLEDAVIEIDKEHIDILLSKKIISNNDEHIFIDFLDEQMNNILETSRKNSKAGKKSAAIRKAKREQTNNDRSTTVQQNSTDKIREEKIILNNASNFKKDLFNSFSMLEAQAKLHSAKIEEIQKHLNNFWLKNYEGKETEKSLNGIRSHFTNWLAKQDIKKYIEPIKHWNNEG